MFEIYKTKMNQRLQNQTRKVNIVHCLRKNIMDYNLQNDTVYDHHYVILL